MKARLVLLVAVAALDRPPRRRVRRGAMATAAPIPPAWRRRRRRSSSRRALRPEGETEGERRSLGEQIAGIDDLGAVIVSELESSAGRRRRRARLREGSRALARRKRRHLPSGVRRRRLQRLRRSRSRRSDAEEAQDFIDKQIEERDEAPQDGSYEGVDFEVESRRRDQRSASSTTSSPSPKTKRPSRQWSTPPSGESLAAEEASPSAIDAAPSGSFADVYVDVGGLIDEVRRRDRPRRAAVPRQRRDRTRRKPPRSASLIPGSDRVEIDLSTDLGGENPPTGRRFGAARLPARRPRSPPSPRPNSASASTKAIDQDRQGRHPRRGAAEQIQETLKEAGIDVEGIAGLDRRPRRLRSTATAKSTSPAPPCSNTERVERKLSNTVSNIGLLLRSSRHAGVTAISGEGERVLDPQPGARRQALVVVSPRASASRSATACRGGSAGLAARSGKHARRQPRLQGSRRRPRRRPRSAGSPTARRR